jgi:hypothetical protein
VDPLPHIKQDPKLVDAGVTVVLAIIGFFAAGLAYLMYMLDHTNFAIALGVIAAVGLAPLPLPYSRWRDHFTKYRRGAK